VHGSSFVSSKNIETYFSMLNSWYSKILRVKILRVKILRVKSTEIKDTANQ